MVKKSDFVLHEEERRKTIKEQGEQQDRMHAQKMIEFEFRRESERISHENGMSMLRIRNAEFNKIQTRKEQLFQAQHQERYKGGRR